MLSSGYQIFAFPPLRDSCLSTIASVLAQADQLRLHLLVPAWLRKPYMQLLMRHATRVQPLRFRAHHGSFSSRPLHLTWTWYLLSYRRGPPPRRPPPPHLGLQPRMSVG